MLAADLALRSSAHPSGPFYKPFSGFRFILLPNVTHVPPTCSSHEPFARSLHANQRTSAGTQTVKKIPPSIISMFAGILLIIMAYRLDYWTYDLRRAFSQQGFGIGQHLTWMASSFFAVLVMAGLLLLWVWFTQRYVQKHPGLSLIYVVLGAMMPIYSLVIISMSIRLNSPSFVVYFSMAPLSLASFASTFIACFGLQRLILRQSAI